MNAINKEQQQQITPSEAMQMLKSGNQRFLSKNMAQRNLLEQVHDTSKGQYPFACILSCIDSRTSVELIFDQGIGDVFSARIAGNIVNEDLLGSMEFACKVAGAKLILVLGHTKCGAIKGACDGVEMGNLTTLLSKIKPAVDAEISTIEQRNSGNAVFVENVAQLNVTLTMQKIAEQSEVLNDMIMKGEIALVGGIYNVENGEVDFFEELIS